MLSRVLGSRMSLTAASASCRVCNFGYTRIRDGAHGLQRSALALLLLALRLLVELLRFARPRVRRVRRSSACRARVGAGAAMPGLTQRAHGKLDGTMPSDRIQDHVPARKINSRNLLAVDAARRLAD